MNPRVMHFDPVKAEQIVGDFCERIGWERKETFTPQECVDLLTRLDYDCTLRTLEEFKEKKYVANTGDAWDAVRLYALTAALESRRRWKRCPSVHDWKKSGVRLQLEQLANDGVSSPISDLDAFTIEDLLLWVTGSDNRQEREALYETLRLKLQGFEE